VLLAALPLLPVSALSTPLPHLDYKTMLEHALLVLLPVPVLLAALPILLVCALSTPGL
jgi:hypothetical protein